MIKELRLGNLLHHPELGSQVFRVSEIDGIGVMLKGTVNSAIKEGELYTTELIPIPITEDKLIEFGYKKKQKECLHDFMDPIKAYLWSNGRMNQFLKVYYDGDRITFTHATSKTIIETVHHLQNIIHANCNEELILNR